MRIPPLLLLCTVLAGAANAADAQAATRPVQVVVSGGMSLPIGGFADTHDLGLHGDVSLLLNGLAGALRLRPELSYSRFKLKDLASGFLEQRGSSLSADVSDYGTDFTSLLAGSANIEFGLGSGGVQPFLLAGLGAISLSSTSLTAESIKETKVALNLGVGVRFRLGSMTGFLEGRVNDVPSDTFKSSLKEVRIVPVTFGLVF